MFVRIMITIARIALKLVSIGSRRNETGRHEMITMITAIEMKPVLAMQELTLNSNHSHEELKAKRMRTLMPKPASTTTPSYSV